MKLMFEAAGVNAKCSETEKYRYSQMILVRGHGASDEYQSPWRNIQGHSYIKLSLMLQSFKGSVGDRRQAVRNWLIEHG